MSTRAFRLTVAAAAIGLGSLTLSVPHVFAQDVPAAPGQNAETAGKSPLVSCLVEPAKLSDASIDIFVSAPTRVFQDVLPDQMVNPMVLASRVRALAASSSATLDPLLGLVSSASPEQLAAIGAGLSRAALTCVTASPEYAALIQSKVAALNNVALLEAYASGVDDVQTAAITGASSPGPAASGIGGTGDPGGGTQGIGDDNGFQNPSEPDYSFPSRTYFGGDDGGQSVDASISESAVTP